MVGSLFMEARSVTVVVFLRENAPNVGVYDSHGYTPKKATGIQFSRSIPF